MRPLPLIAAPIALLLMLTPIAAQTLPNPSLPDPAQEPPSLLEEGAKLFLRGLMSEVEPTLDEMGRALDGIEPALRDMAPRLRELVTLMGDAQYYMAPERLANGDILIRRKPGSPPPAPLPEAPLKEGEIEL